MSEQEINENEEHIDIDNDEEDVFPISEESAERQFRVFLKYYDISFDDIVVTDGKKTALTIKNYIVRSIRRGRLEIVLEERKVKLTHNLDYPIGNINQIIYRDKVALARVAVNKAEENDDAVMIFMAAISGVPVGTFIKMLGADSTLYSRLSSVFSLV